MSTTMRKHWRVLLAAGNVTAGISVGAYLIPQAMAYASLAGIPPATGLTVAAIPLLVYALFGRNTFLSMGPESAVALMAGTMAIPIADKFNVSVPTVLALCSVLVGAILFIGWLAKASFLADLLSYPILVGYLTGVAILMILSQIGKIVGYSTNIEKVEDLFTTSWQKPVTGTVVIAVVVVVISFVTKRISPRLPGVLFGMVAGTLLGLYFKVPTVGEVSLSLPAITSETAKSFFNTELIAATLPSALSIALVAFADVLVVSRAFVDGKRTNPSTEMRTLAVVQAAAGISGGYPVSASTSRTALAKSSGAESRSYNVIVVAVLLAGPLLIPGVLSKVPISALAGVVVFAALSLISVEEWKNLASFRRSETLVAAGCATAVAVLGILPGVILAVLLAIIDILTRLARPRNSILGFVPDLAGMHNVDDWEDVQTIPSLTVFRYDAPIFFLNASDFYDRVVNSVSENTNVILLNMEANVELDTTALESLKEVVNDLKERNVEVWLCRVKRSVYLPLKAYGLVSSIQKSNIFPTLPTAVEEYRRRYPEGKQTQ